MELKEFVATALTQIFEGIQDAQARTLGNGEINPGLVGGMRLELAKQGIFMSAGDGWVRSVEFDVAVTIGASEGLTGGMGLVVGPFVIGAKGEAESQSSTISRIRFAVPVAYPKK